ncbi:MAG: hypothetical protein DSY76_04420 [Bacteroidetes bacterium]|nr:MAG: hypothetical protein DSY76_04420 [Bacteroidota bacterium]
MKTIKYYLENESLKSVLFVALLLRLIAVIFAKGFGMHDDHFLVIEVAQSWVDGFDYNNWLPWSAGNTGVPQGHSLFYVGIHFLILSFFKLIGFTNPDYQMYAIRLLHALYSLLVVSLSYKITLKLSNKKNAVLVAWLLAVSWFMPWLSVRNLVEMVSIPPMLYSVWVIIRDDSNTAKKYLWAGFIGMLAFSIRFQGILFIGGIGLVLLIQKQWRETFFYGLGGLFSIVLIQGGIDMFVWHRPFAEFFEYVNYNLHNSGEYPNGPWYNYILLLTAFFTIPYGLMLLVGFLNVKKKWLIVFVPTLIFLAFHSYFPNKQERFIFPILPMYVMLGVVGWQALLDSKLQAGFWKMFTKVSLVIYLLISFAILPFITTGYSKRARVEAMLFLNGKPDTERILVDATSKAPSKALPQYYASNWKMKFRVLENESDYDMGQTKFPQKYVLFFGQTDLPNRIHKMEAITGPLKQEFIALPSLIDRTLQSMNKVNANDTIFVYSINKQQP